MKKFFLGITVLFFALIHASASANSKVTTEMEKIAKQFSDYSTNRYANQPTLAVLPFQAEKKLSERGIGIAIGELLTAFILKTKTFNVVERAELKKILEEQKLGLTGVIESKTAIAVGHILGCQIVVIGNVVRLGESYQISARMIDVLTGEVLIAAFTEVDTETLDEQAMQYVVIVPEKEKIGIYVVYATPILDLAPTVQRLDNINITVESDSTHFSNQLGVGLRYFLLKNLFADLSFIPSYSTTQQYRILYDFNLNVLNDNDYKLTVGNTYAASLNYMFVQSKYIHAFAGFGILSSSINIDSRVGGQNAGTPNGYVLHGSSIDKKFNLPFITAGIELILKQRFGTIFAVDYLQGKPPNMDGFSLQNVGGAGDIPITLVTPELHRFIYKLMACLYF